MLLKTIKTAADLPFKGIELITVDKQITEVIIGGKLRIRRGDTYGSNLALLVEQPFEIAKRFQLTATRDGFDPKISYFENRWEADTAASNYGGIDVTTAVEEVEVQIDEAGEVVNAVMNGAATTTRPELCDIPF